VKIKKIDMYEWEESGSGNPEKSFKRVFCEPSKGFEIGKWAYLPIAQKPGY
jgi:hypothetical protein